MQLSGSVDASADVHLDLIVGVNDTDGFYIETGGASPQLSISDIQVTGNLDGDGRLGFLAVELENATVAVNGVTVAVTLTAPTGNKIHISDLGDPSQIASLAAVNVTGPGTDAVVLQAGIKVSAILPDDDSPFTIAGAGITVHWDDITQPTNVRVEFAGGIGDFLKVRVQDVLDKLTQLRDGMAAIGVNVPFISSGLGSVISVLQVLDDNLVQAGGGGSASFLTVQDLEGRLSQRLNESINQFGLGFSGGSLTWDFALGGPVLSASGLGFSGISGTLSNVHVTIGVDLAKLIDLGGGSSYSITNALSFVVSGELGDVNLFDVLQGGLQFEVSRKTVDVNVDGGAFNPAGGTDLHDATLTTFGLNLDEASSSDPETRFLTIGTSDASVTVQDGTLGVAFLSPSAPADSRRWVAVKGVGLTGAVNLGGVVTAAAGGIGISFNSASGGASALNWASAVDLDDTGAAGTFAADPVTVLGTTIDLAGGVTSVSGSLTGVNVAGVLTGAAEFNVTKESVSVNDDGDTGTPAVSSVLLAVLLSNLSLRIGIADVFVSVTSGTVNVYSASPVVADGRSWLAVDASGIGGSLQLGSLASATVSNGVIRINRVTGATRALNWTSDVVGATVALPTLTGTLTLVSGHLGSLVIGSFVHGSADFDLSKSLVGVHLTTEDLANALLLTLGLSN